MLTMKQFENLEVGDIIEVDKPLMAGLSTEPAELQVVSVDGPKVRFDACYFGVPFHRIVCEKRGDTLHWRT